MPVVQHAIRELRLKIVYYGPGLGGKTTNLIWLHEHSRPELRGKLLSLATESDRTYFFDLLPVDLGDFKGYRIRLQLCTVPGQIALDSTRRLVLRHVDGVVFVVDSQRDALSRNVESILNLETNLLRQGDDPGRVPLVVQYNKRDLPGVASIAELHEALNVPAGVPEVEACARTGSGVGETLKLAVKECLQLIRDPKRVREGHSPSLLPGIRPSMYPDLAPPSLQVPLIPKPPRVPQGLRHAPPTRRELIRNDSAQDPTNYRRAARKSAG